MAFHAREIYEQASPDEKRLLFSEIFTNFQQNRYKIRPNYTLAGEYLKNWMPKVNENYELALSSQNPIEQTTIKQKAPQLKRCVLSGSGAGIRTQDPPVNSRLLYR